MSAPDWYDTDEFYGLAGIVAEGATDAVFGRPKTRNPYSPAWSIAYGAWELGWTFGREFLETRGVRETRRWLEAA